jgi:hypothetical protein
MNSRRRVNSAVGAHRLTLDKHVRNLAYIAFHFLCGLGDYANVNPNPAMETIRLASVPRTADAPNLLARPYLSRARSLVAGRHHVFRDLGLGDHLKTFTSVNECFRREQPFVLTCAPTNRWTRAAEACFVR